MTGTELATAPRKRFAERFALLYAEAGNPPLKRITESVLRAREVDDQGRPVRVPAQRISDWRRGNNVPARFAGLSVVLQVLIGEARKRRRDPVVAGLYDLQAWQRLWEAALASPIVPAGGNGTAEALSEGNGHTEPDGSLCPYRGLAAFRQSDSGWFYGRERSTEQLLERLRQATASGGFVMLVGASGAGKSSLLRAGLGPTLAAGTLSDEQQVDWPILALTPGREPLTALTEHLAELAGPLQAAAKALGTGADPVTPEFTAAVRAATRDFAEGHADVGAGVGAGVVVLVDQFEELFTLCPDEDTRLLFLRALHAMCTPSEPGGSAPALVVLGVRADFYDRCLGYPEIVEATQGRQMALGAMSAQELSDAVERPARAVGLQLERGLVDLMLADLGATVHRVKGRSVAAGYDAGALPLLSHALLATWQRRQGGKLTLAGYRAAGGIHGAVAATAERAWDALDDAGKAAARRILLHLVQVGDTTRDVRKRASRGELVDPTGEEGPATERALEVLAAARLVTLDADSVEITHEALLEAWPRLRSWIDDNRAENLTRQRLEADAAAWDEQGRDTSLLYRGARLESSTRLPRGPASIEITQVAKDFLATAARHARRARRLRRSGVALVCVLALIAASAAAIAIDQRDEAEFQQIVTEADHTLASDPSLSAQLSLVADRLRPDDAQVDGRLLAMQHVPLATPLPGHSGAVYLAKYRADGKLLATASEDRTVRLWRIPERGRPVLASTLHTGDEEWVGSAVFSPDGRTLATAGADGAVKLWDVSDPEQPEPIGRKLGSGDNGYTFMIAFSPDGGTLASASGDGAVRLWDVSDPADAKARGKLTGHTKAVRSVAFSADGTMLATGSDDHDIRLWKASDPDNIKPIGGPLRGAADMVHAVAFSPDGRTLAAGVEDSTVWLWDIRKPSAPKAIGQPLAGHEDLVWEVAFSPDGRTLASASSDGTARLWNVADPRRAGALGRPLSAPSGIVYAVEFSPDGRTLVTGSDDGVTRLWNLPPRLLAAHTEGVSAVAVGPRGKLLATGGSDQRAQVWRIGADKRPEQVGKPLTGPRGNIGHLAFSPGGDVLAVGSDDLSVRLWQVSDPARPKRIGKPLTGNSGYFSPDGKLLVTVEGTELRIFDISDPTKPELVRTIDTAHKAYITSAAFSPGSRMFATGSFDKTVQLWDLSNPAKPARVGKPLAGNAGSVWAVAFGPDGRMLAAASGDRTARLWDIGRRGHPKPVGEPLRGHTDAVNAIAFSPRGDRLITGSFDKTVRLWSTADGTSTELIGHTGVVGDVAFSPDGRTFLSGSGDGTARLWRLSERESIDRICRNTRGVLTPQVWDRHVPQLDYDPPC